MRLLKRIVITAVSIVVILAFALFIFFEYYKPALSKNHGKVDAQLFVGASENQPLVVAFGGSQGGNTWTEDYWTVIRTKFLEKGYAVLSIAYFNTENTPETLDRISLNAIYDTIRRISKHPKIDENKIALLGSSRGAELILNLASRYKEINAVVALVPSHVTFASGTITSNTSAWTFNGTELGFAKIPFRAIVPAIRGESMRLFEMAFEEENTANAIIPVEEINGPILLLSAKDDALWP
jgi:pimeloyl-ACP methyl ester carboxylesterase